MKKIIILVFLYVIFAFATGMSIDNGELAINPPSDKVPEKKTVEIRNITNIEKAIFFRFSTS